MGCNMVGPNQTSGRVLCIAFVSWHALAVLRLKATANRSKVSLELSCRTAHFMAAGMLSCGCLEVIWLTEAAQC